MRRKSSTSHYCG